MNYSELYDKIVEYTQNSETTFLAAIPTFVRNAERRIYHDCADLPRLRLTSDVTAIPFQSIYSLPTDFLAPVSLSVEGSTGFISYPDNKEPEYARIAFAGSAANAPRVYAITDHDSFLVLPAPDTDYTLRLTYYGYPESIVTASTTWLGDNFEFVLLYGALVEAYTFMKGEADMMQAYTLQYKDSLALLKEFAASRSHSDKLRHAQGA